MQTVELLGTPRARRIILYLSALLALAGLLRLCLSVYYVSGKSGYDFRYFWLAGRIWAVGEDPYSSNYQKAGVTLITDGHVPELWVYPPSWWPLSRLLALTDLNAASVLWNIAGIVLCFAASFLVVRAFYRVQSGQSCNQSVAILKACGILVLALLHFSVIAELEATNLVIGIGQNSIFVYFCIAALLYGIAKGSLAVSALALSIIFLKPQVGLPFAALFLIYSSWSRRVLSIAIAVSVAFILPSMFIEPLSPFEFIRNANRYSDFKPNMPQAVTGLRLCVWEVLGRDCGNVVPSIAAALASVVGVFAFKPLHAEDEQEILWLCATLTTAITITFAPLHFYDFVIVGVLYPTLLVAPAPAIGAAFLGTGLIFRADALGKATGLYDPAVGIFEGSILSTVGAGLLLVAAWSACSRVALGLRISRLDKKHAA